MAPLAALALMAVTLQTSAAGVEQPSSVLSTGGSATVRQDAVSAAGYWLVASDGGLFAFGNALFAGSTGGLRLNRPIVGMASTPSGRGYWLVASDGGLFAFGDALFAGSTGALRLNQPIVAMAATPSGKGYWLVAADGGIFAFGDALFAGSTGALRLNRPIVGMASTPSGRGYWLVASDGGIFGFGDALFAGSTGAVRLNQPIVAMAATPSGRGYWLVASDGGIFAFGDALFAGSTGALRLNRPIVGMAPALSGRGYWLVASDGGIFAFGDAVFAGSTGSVRLNQPIVSMASAQRFVPDPPPVTTPPVVNPPQASPQFEPVRGLRVQGDHFVDGAGAPVRLRGMNRMSTEYACIQGWGIAEGPATSAELNQTLDAMIGWHANAVRVPLNQDCWLGTKPGLNPDYTGAPYRSVIIDWVNRITAKQMVAIVDLHWTAPAGVAALGQQPMADRDYSPTLWSQVADTFKSNPNVMFDLFNEPYLERDTYLEGVDPWVAWRDGALLHVHDEEEEVAETSYQSAGMQELVTAVRSTGATNPIMLGGLSYSQLLSRSLAQQRFHLAVGMRDRLPFDPAGQLVVSFHPYDGNPCAWSNSACLRTEIDSVAGMPVVVGEYGRGDCSTSGIEGLLDLLDSYGGRVSYLAWVWTVTHGENNCNGFDYGVITDYYTGSPSATGAAVRGHYLGP